jgi:hypothetical protein
VGDLASYPLVAGKANAAAIVSSPSAASTTSASMMVTPSEARTSTSSSSSASSSASASASASASSGISTSASVNGRAGAAMNVVTSVDPASELTLSDSDDGAAVAAVGVERLESLHLQQQHSGPVQPAKKRKNVVTSEKAASIDGSMSASTSASSGSGSGSNCRSVPSNGVGTHNGLNGVAAAELKSSKRKLEDTFDCSNNSSGSSEDDAPATAAATRSSTRAKRPSV